MKHEDLIAIDIHTHAEVSCWNPFDNYGEEYDRAADKFFGSNRRPTIEETVAYYRERKIGLVMFTVDSESQLGRRRIPNEEIAKAARERGFPAVAVADRNGLYGVMAFGDACKAAGVQPIVGALLSVARPGQRLANGAPQIDWLALYAQDETGYGNLCALVSSAHLGRPVELDPHVGLSDLAGLGEGMSRGVPLGMVHAADDALHFIGGGVGDARVQRCLNDMLAGGATEIPFTLL